MESGDAQAAHEILIVLEMRNCRLPNVGKSDSLQCSDQRRGLRRRTYPFCTIDPNIGIVEVPDPRLAKLAGHTPSRRKSSPPRSSFVDIAGLVAGASKGEGLGNQFLANIRECDAIAARVRCFEDANVVHVAGTRSTRFPTSRPSTPSSRSPKDDQKAGGYISSNFAAYVVGNEDRYSRGGDRVRITPHDSVAVASTKVRRARRKGSACRPPPRCRSVAAVERRAAAAESLFSS